MNLAGPLFISISSSLVEQSSVSGGRRLQSGGGASIGMRLLRLDVGSFDRSSSPSLFSILHEVMSPGAAEAERDEGLSETPGN